MISRQMPTTSCGDNSAGRRASRRRRIERLARRAHGRTERDGRCTGQLGPGDGTADRRPLDQQVLQGVVDLVDLTTEIIEGAGNGLHGEGNSKAWASLPAALPLQQSRRRKCEAGMFEAEAAWLERLLRQWAPEQLSPLLNVGSSTRAFREITQPWTDRRLFQPLRQRGVKLIHLNSKDGDGIDIARRYPVRRRPAEDHGVPAEGDPVLQYSGTCPRAGRAGAPLHGDRRPRRADLRHRAAQLSASSRPDRHHVSSGAG